jgi:hypothetical protein
MEVAAEFHQNEVLVWLLRDATVCERELLGVFAFERKLADMLLVTFENGFRPWWYRTREVSLKWRASSELEVVSPPKGFSARGGWLGVKYGGESALPALDSEYCGFWFRSWSVGKQDMTYAALPANVTTIGDCALSHCSCLTMVAIPSSVTVIAAFAFCFCSALSRLSIPLSVTAIGQSAFHGCSGLRQLEIPSSVRTVGACAFCACSGLIRVEIRSGGATIGYHAFCCCSNLRQLQIPSDLAQLGGGVFMGVAKLERLILVGSALSPAVVTALEGCLTSTARVVGAALVTRRFGPFTIGSGWLGRFTPGGGKFGRFMIEAG